MPFKMMGKSPLMKKLVGNQSRLPEHLKAKIKAAPESPAKLKKASPAKNTEEDLKKKYPNLIDSEGNVITSPNQQELIDRRKLQEEGVRKKNKRLFDEQEIENNNFYKDLDFEKNKNQETKKAAVGGGGSSNTTVKKPTYSQAWEKMTPAAQKKYKSKAEFIKAAKAYNNRGKTGATTETKTETKTGTGTGTGTGKVTNANDISGNTGRGTSVNDIKRRAAESAKKKAAAAAEAAAKKKAAAEEAKKNKKLTPKEKRKSERNIKAQQKANRIIRRKGEGTEIKVDKKNTTATAADRRKLKQGAKRLEQKLSLAQKEIDRKNKKKKEDKKGKDKKKKIVPKQKREM